MLTHSAQQSLVVAVPTSRNSRHAHHQWLPVSLALFAALATALSLSVTHASTEDTVAPSSVHAPNDVLTSVGQRSSNNRRYSAEVISASPGAIGAAQTWTVHVARRGNRVAHASIEAQVVMPETAERSPVPSRIRYVGDGNYRIEKVLFTRTGWWNVALVIDGSRGTDSVAFNVIIPSPTLDETHASTPR